MKNYIIFITPIFLLLTISQVHPQNILLNTIEDIEKDTNHLAQENLRLQRENSLLEAEILRLKGVAGTQSMSERNKMEYGDFYGMSSSAMSIAEIEDEIAKMDREIKRLKMQYDDLSRTDSVWRLRLADLQAKEQSIAMDMKIDESIQSGGYFGSDPKVQRLQEELEESQRVKNELVSMIATYQDHESGVPIDEKAIIIENRKILQEIKELEEHMEDYEKKFDTLLERNLNLRLTLNSGEIDKSKLLDILIQEVTLLEGEVVNKKENVQLYTVIQDAHRSLIDASMYMGQENHQLRLKIDEINEKINEFAEENTILEDELQVLSGGRYQ